MSKFSNKFFISNRFEFLDLDTLHTKNDFIKARAETDSSALKKRFMNDEIYRKNFETFLLLVYLFESGVKRNKK